MCLPGEGAHAQLSRRHPPLPRRGRLTQTGVQSLAPAALFLALGLLQLYTFLHPELAWPGADLRGALQSLVGFLAWWTAASWALFCFLDLWLFRTGTLQN